MKTYTTLLTQNSILQRWTSAPWDTFSLRHNYLPYPLFQKKYLRPSSILYRLISHNGPWKSQSFPRKRQAEYSLLTFVKILFFRVSVQKALWEVYLTLVEAGMVSFEGLEWDIHFGTLRHYEVASIWSPQKHFKKVHEISDYWTWTDFGFDALLVGLKGCPTPFCWLATLIVRGAIYTHLWEILGFIGKIGVFGKMDWGSLGSIWKRESAIKRDGSACSVENRKGKEKMLSVFGERWDGKMFEDFEDILCAFFGIDKGREGIGADCV